MLMNDDDKLILFLRKLVLFLTKEVVNAGGDPAEFDLGFPVYQQNASYKAGEIFLIGTLTSLLNALSTMTAAFIPTGISLSQPSGNRTMAKTRTTLIPGQNQVLLTICISLESS